MRIRTMMSALMLIIAVAAYAQPGPGHKRGGGTPEERAKMMTDRMAEKLNLSDDQKEALLAVNLDQAKQMESSRKESREELKAKREEMKASREKYDAQVKQILNDEQFAEYEKQKEARRAKMAEKRHERAPDMSEKLD